MMAVGDYSSTAIFLLKEKGAGLPLINVAKPPLFFRVPKLLCLI
jgi:hypothetical protein